MHRNLFFIIAVVAILIMSVSAVQAQDNRSRDVRVEMNVQVQVPMETRIETHTTYQSYGNVRAYTTYPGCPGHPNTITPHPYRHSRSGPVCRQPVQIFEIGVK